MRAHGALKRNYTVLRRLDAQSHGGRFRQNFRNYCGDEVVLAGRNYAEDDGIEDGLCEAGRVVAMHDLSH